MTKVKERFDIMVNGGTFTTKDGREKTRWTKIGVTFKGEDGSMWGIIELVPTLNWDGKFNLFKPKENEQPQQPQPQNGFGNYQQTYNESPF